VSRLGDYATRYRNARIRREDGIVEVLLHTGGESLRWGELVRRELCQLFADIGSDTENRTVILSGTGPDFCAEFEQTGWTDSASPASRDKNYWEGRHLLRNLADIEVPVIAAVNGPAHIHAELPAMCDVVLAAETASFRDPHYQHGRVPGDGVHIIWPLLLGLNRAKYFQLSGRVMTAQEAMQLGVVAEVCPDGKVLGRAWDVARQLGKASTLQLRYTRVVLNLQLRAALSSDLGYGLALESLAALDAAATGRPGPHDGPEDS
jgi:enoyl-CoA hydratase/carnithine racemase